MKEVIKQTMSSREIAELTGKNHSDVMRSIRVMEDAWVKVSECKFALAEYIDEQGKKRPQYELSKSECLYVATKFNDEARAKLVIRWEKLENDKSNFKPLSPLEMIIETAKVLQEQDKKLSLLDERLSAMEHNTTEARKMLTSLPDGGAVPDKSFRSLCNEKVRAYSVQSGLPYSEIWAIAYKELYYLYGVNLNTRSKNKGMSKLDAAEEMGVMKDLYAVVSKICG